VLYAAKDSHFSFTDIHNFCPLPKPKPAATSPQKAEEAVKEGTPEPGEITGNEAQANANMGMANGNFDMNAMNMMGMMMGMNPMMQFQALQMQATQVITLLEPLEYLYIQLTLCMFQTVMALQNPQLPPPMRMQLMMQLQMQQNAMQMLMGGHPMAMMGGNNNMGNTGHSGANTPNGNHHMQSHHQQPQHQPQPQQQRRPVGRSPQKMGNGLPMQGQAGQLQQQTANPGQGNGSPNQIQNAERTGSKRKLDDLSDEGQNGAKDDSETKAPKQIKTQ
jgi:hypothetical protein